MGVIRVYICFIVFECRRWWPVLLIYSFVIGGLICLKLNKPIVFPYLNVFFVCVFLILVLFFIFLFLSPWECLVCSFVFLAGSASPRGW